ncbi:RNase H domain-containing protein [Trichonephila clavipes]|nr:RNase H domain-containing protein [Trichonephila clavipes]
MSYDYSACKRSLERLFGLGALGKIKLVQNHCATFRLVLRKRITQNNDAGLIDVRDNVGVSILTKLKRLSTSHQIHLQWIPSHVDLEENEIADILAKAGARELPEPSAPLTFLEIFSRTKDQNKTAWITPRAPLVSMFSSWRLSGSRFYKTGSNSAIPLSKWPYPINEIFRRTQEL